MKPINFIASLLLTAAFAVAAFAQLPTDKIDAYVQQEMQSKRIPGVAIAIVRNGELAYAKGYGLASVEHKVAVKPETIFQSGSVGKQFAATAVMMLIADGKLALDDPITKHLKDAPAAWEKITVRHLLTHTSGMTDYPPNFDYRRDWTEDELLKEIAKISPAFAPGEKWSYSNMGYVTLGILISKVTGKFYGEFLQERIFKPAGMATARIISEADIVPNRSSGYRLVNGELKHQAWVSPALNTTGDGSLYLTVLDLAKWDAALYGEKLLKRASLDLMWTPVKLNDGKTAPYGFGWSLNEVRGQRLIEHGGSWQGFKSAIARYMNDKLTVILLANLAQVDPSAFAHGVAGVINPSLAPEPPKPIEDKEPQVTAKLQQLLKELTAGTAKPDDFTPEFAAQLFPVGAKEGSKMLKTLGTLSDVALLRRSERNRLQGYSYRLKFEKAIIKCSLILNAAGKVAGLNLEPE